MRHRPAGAALDGEDRLGGDARTDAAALPTAAKFLDDAADRPRDHQLRVIRDRFFEIDPGLRQACEVDGQYEWFHIRLGRRSAPQAALGRCKNRRIESMPDFGGFRLHARNLASARGPPTLAASPLRCPHGESNSRLGATLRREFATGPGGLPHRNTMTP